MGSAVIAQPGSHSRLRPRGVGARRLAVVAACVVAMGLWSAPATGQAGGRLGGSKDEPNVIQPPPFFGDTPKIDTGPATGTGGSHGAGPARPATPANPPVSPESSGLIATPAPTASAKWSPSQIGQTDRAIRAGLDYLYKIQKPDGSWQTKYATQHPGGVEALVILAALSAGDDFKRPQLVKALAQIEQLAPKTTYVRAVRTMVYARLGGEQYRARLQADVGWLVANLTRSFGWGYGPGYRTTRENPSWVDNSNTFLAMLALRQAELAGAKVSPAIWSRLRTYWARNANPDGGMSYQPPAVKGFRLRGTSYGSMTAAGLRALYILTDTYAQHVEPNFALTKFRRANASPFEKAIRAARRWMASHVTVEKNPRWVWGAGEAYEYYYLWCLLGMADEAGLDRIGKLNVARDVAAILCERQKPSGCWTDPSPAPGAAAVDDMTAIRTCFAIMALTRARSAVAIDKIAFGPSAENDPRDAANLARWLGRNLGWRVTWRQITLGTQPAGYRPAPLLYVQAGDTNFPDALAARVQATVDVGGMVLVQPFAGRKDIADAAKLWLRSILGDLTAAELPADHLLYTLRFDIPAPSRPKVFALGDACRIRAMVLETDAGGAWHQYKTADHLALFQLPANVLVYTTDMQPPVSRLAADPCNHVLPTAKSTVRMARLRHAGDWNVCKGAMGKLAGVLANSFNIGLEVGPAVDAAAGIDPKIPVLWMTGTGPAKLTTTQRIELKAYLTGGGTLLIDSAMGTKPMIDDARAALTAMFGPDAVKEMPADHPLITGAFGGGIGCDLTGADYTRAAKTSDPMAGVSAAKPGPPKLLYVAINGRAAVIVSPLSVVVPLSGQRIFNCRGLSEPDAARLAANVVLYALVQRR